MNSLVHRSISLLLISIAGKDFTSDGLERLKHSWASIDLFITKVHYFSSFKSWSLHDSLLIFSFSFSTVRPWAWRNYILMRKPYLLWRFMIHRSLNSFSLSFLSPTKNCNHKGLGIYYLFSAFIFGISGTLISVLIRIELYSSGNRIISPENQNFYNISITFWRRRWTRLMLEFLVLFFVPQI